MKAYSMTRLEPPLEISLFWDCEILYNSNGPFFNGPARKVFRIRQTINYNDLVEKVCAYRGLDQRTVRIQITMRRPKEFGSTVMWSTAVISDDEDMQLLWDHANIFKGQDIELHIQIDSNVQTQQPLPHIGPYTTMLNALSPNDLPNIGEQNIGFHCQLRDMPGQIDMTTHISSSTGSNLHSISLGCMPPIVGDGSGSSSQLILNVTIPEHFPIHVTPVDTMVANEPCWVGTREAMVDGLGATSDIDGPISSDSPDTDEAEDSDDVVEDAFGMELPNLNVEAGPSGTAVGTYEPSYATFLENMARDSDDPECDRDETQEALNVCIDEWSETNSDLRLGMRFEDKKQAVYAVRKWSVQRGREFQVVESKGKMWTAKCKNSTPRYPCPWKIRVIKKANRDF